MSSGSSSADGGGGYGEDIAVLDAGYYLSQIILSLFMGQLVESTGLPHLYIAMASLCAFVASVCSYKMVAFTQEDVLMQQRKGGGHFKC